MEKYTVFNQEKFDSTKEPIFLGNSVNVARYDKQKYSVFERLIQKQLSFFWRPEEIDLSKDRSDFIKMPDHERHIFLSNLKYQTLLDSIQGRSPNICFLPICSLPEFETWVTTWTFSETIHSRSYTHIIRNIVTDPSVIFDEIVVNKEIIKRATTISDTYDKMIEASNLYSLGFIGKNIKVDDKNILVTEDELKDRLYLLLINVYLLEAIRFYVSFACTFAFGERSIMEGNAKIVRLIARDEALHKYGTQVVINNIQSGKEGKEWKDIAERNKEKVIEMIKLVAEQEKMWANYLFKDGSMIGLNAKILNDYISEVTYDSAKAINIEIDIDVKGNSLPWMKNWLMSDNVQVAPQETEISSYLVGQIDNSINDQDLNELEL